MRIFTFGSILIGTLLIGSFFFLNSPWSNICVLGPILLIAGLMRLIIFKDRNVSGVILSVFFAFLVYACVKLFIIGFYRVTNIAMEPSLYQGQRILVWKLFYEPGKDDIIVYRGKTNRNKLYVHRIFAGPGDLIDIKDGKISINGIVVEESDTIPDVYSTVADMVRDAGQEAKVPENTYGLVGDNLSVKEKGRIWGFVSKENVVGKVIAVFR